MVRTYTKIFGEIVPGVLSNGAKMCFVIFVSTIQRSLADTYPAPISTTFETTDMNCSSGAYIHEKFLIFCRGVLKAPKICPRSSILSGVLITNVQLKQHNFGRQESFWGLLLRSTVWALWPPNKGHSIVNTTPFSLIFRRRKNTVQKWMVDM